MTRALIIPNINNDRDMHVTKMVVAGLNSYGITSYIDRRTATVDGAVAYDVVTPECDLVIVIGGDGSVIDASRYAIEMNVPLLGVNLGKVGYLAEVEPDMLDVLTKLKDGDYHIEEKMLLYVEKDGVILPRLAVNDVVVSHESYLGIAEFRLEDSNGNAIKYRSDGVILSTPQGSTAYSLSAGGPVMAHDVAGILVTPVCPHSFFNRSVLFNSTEVFMLTNLGAHNMNISIDGRLVTTLGTEECCRVGMAKEKIKMITFSKNSMFSKLFRKMKILEDIK